MGNLDTGLRALGGVDLTRDPVPFTLTYDGRRIEVDYETFHDNDLRTLSLTIPYDRVAKRPDPTAYRDTPPLRAIRPLAIELRKEGGGDVVAKREGTSVEWQSGDERFDRDVYVSTPTVDGAVLSAVLGRSTRAGALALFEMGFDHVGIDVEGRVEARIALAALTSERETNEERAERALAAFDTLIEALPIVAHVGGKHAAVPLAGWTKALGLIGAIGWLGNAAYAMGIALIVETITGREPADVPVLTIVGVVVAALVGGGLGARLWSRLVVRRLRGRSDAHTRTGMASLSAFGGFSVLTFTVAWATVLATH